MREEDIPFIVGMRVIAKKMGLAEATVRKRIQRKQWDALPKLFRTGPRGDWKCEYPELESFIRKFSGGAP